ncbi:hypothetical protein SAMN04515668_3054 [Hymenobacter arizonensis]|uniref:Uncharacterized protein n=1 Tax=Hymenobacter arizonensis TaxID=1227077 RepID=A0A1I5ZN46_HYMAR|nr:hypothetical protein SAMN04515668_3054 [Hymenobacter arizonensis]
MYSGLSFVSLATMFHDWRRPGSDAAGAYGAGCPRHSMVSYGAMLPNRT